MEGQASDLTVTNQLNKQGWPEHHPQIFIIDLESVIVLVCIEKVISQPSPMWEKGKVVGVVRSYLCFLGIYTSSLCPA